MTKRIYYLDYLKVFLTVLVILHHVAIAFGGEGAFIIASKTTGSTIFSLGLTGFLAINQSYFMALFFAISSYFSFSSFNKKGKDAFIKSKFKRLLLPATAYFFIISPLLSLCIDVVHRQKALSSISIRYGIGALWFVLALFLFDVIYALFGHKILKNIQSKHLLIMLPIVVVSTFIVRILWPVGTFIPWVAFQPAHFMQYIFAYMVGIAFSKNNTLKVIQFKPLERYLLCVLPVLGLLALVIVTILNTYGDITYAFGGLNIFSMLYSLFDILMFTFMGLGLLGLFKKYLNRNIDFMNWMSHYAFSTYVMHSTAITLSVIVINHVFHVHWISFVIVSVTSIALSFLLGRLTKSILG